MFDLIGRIISFFYSVWPSYGMSIIFLTLTVMVVVAPLTLRSTRSMLQMQRLQPELKKIQNEYRDDRQKMNEELMAFYQENGINPLGGCLPLLIQLPVFLVLFRVVQGLTRRVTGIGEQIGWTAGRVGGLSVDADAALLDSVDVPERTFDPEHLDESSELYEALSNDNEMVSWGIDLSQSAQRVLSDNFVDALPYLLLIVVVLVSSLVQQRQIQGRNTGAQINPQQQAIMKILPFMLPVFSFTMPAALVIYFVVSNLFRIGQQAYITRALYSGDDSPGAQLRKQREEESKGGGGRKASGGRVTPKKGEPTAKRDGGKSSDAKNKDAKDKKADRDAKPTRDAKPKRAAKPKRGAEASGTARSSGSGRTGRAPSRQARPRGGGGRTTDPGTRQHRKKKK